MRDVQTCDHKFRAEGTPRRALVLTFFWKEGRVLLCEQHEVLTMGPQETCPDAGKPKVLQSNLY